MENVGKNEINISKDLPQMPEILASVFEVIKNFSTNPNELAEIIEKNQALKEKLLKLVNSSYFALGQNITSVQKAAFILGIMKIKNIVMVLSLKDVLNEELFIHSLECAIASEILATKKGVLNPDDAFAMGFLHDIGKYPFYKNYPDTYKNLEEKSETDFFDIIEEENQQFGTNHSLLSATVLKKWLMPPMLTDCVKYHHSPTLSAIPVVSGIVYAADKIVQNKTSSFALERNIVDRLGFSIEDPKTLKLQIKTKSELYINQIN